MEKFYTSKVLLEVEVDHQFSPEQAIQSLFDRLKYPAIRNKKILRVATNYELYSEPLSNFYDINFKEPT